MKTPSRTPMTRKESYEMTVRMSAIAKRDHDISIKTPSHTPGLIGEKPSVSLEVQDCFTAIFENDSSHRQVADLSPENVEIQPHEREYYAKLFAAAPDMLEALEMAAMQFGDKLTHRPLLNRIRETITKATS